MPSIEEFEKKITEKTKAILICNPGNPTGYLYTREELKKFEIRLNAWKNKNLDLTIYSDQFVYNSNPTRGYALKSKDKLDKEKDKGEPASERKKKDW